MQSALLAELGIRQADHSNLKYAVAVGFNWYPWQSAEVGDYFACFGPLAWCTLSQAFSLVIIISV